MLVTLDVTGNADDACISNLVLSDSSGSGLDYDLDCTSFTVGTDCADADADGICDDIDDCVGEYDECGVCNGSGADYECWDGSSVCDLSLIHI